MDTCDQCLYWYRNKYPAMEADDYEGCGHPKMETDGNYIHTGGFDGNGDYFHTSAKFGCILFERKDS